MPRHKSQLVVQVNHKATSLQKYVTLSSARCWRARDPAASSRLALDPSGCTRCQQNPRHQEGWRRTAAVPVCGPSHREVLPPVLVLPDVRRRVESYQPVPGPHSKLPLKEGQLEPLAAKSLLNYTNSCSNFPVLWAQSKASSSQRSEPQSESCTICACGLTVCVYKVLGKYVATAQKGKSPSLSCRGESAYTLLVGLNG